MGYHVRAASCIHFFLLLFAVSSAWAGAPFNVQSTPISGVQMLLSVDGGSSMSITTSFSTNIENRFDYRLEAPAIWQKRPFIEWKLNGSSHSTSTVIEDTMENSSLTYLAVYGPPQVTLNVTSSPEVGIQFDNEDIFPFVTPYERVFSEEEPYEAIVRAPLIHNGRPFSRWLLNGEVLSNFHIAYITMDQDYDLEAQYGSGSITCKIQPKAARKKARWRVNGGPWLKRGATVTDLLVGEHFVEWKEVPGFTTPNSRMVPVEDGDTHTIRGRYFPK